MNIPVDPPRFSRTAGLGEGIFIRTRLGSRGFFCARGGLRAVRAFAVPPRSGHEIIDLSLSLSLSHSVRTLCAHPTSLSCTVLEVSRCEFRATPAPPPRAHAHPPERELSPGSLMIGSTRGNVESLIPSMKSRRVRCLPPPFFLLLVQVGADRQPVAPRLVSAYANGAFAGVLLSPPSPCSPWVAPGDSPAAPRPSAS